MIFGLKDILIILTLIMYFWLLLQIPMLLMTEFMVQGHMIIYLYSLMHKQYQSIKCIYESQLLYHI